MPSLADLIREIANKAPGTSKGSGGAFFIQGTVTEVMGDGKVAVQTDRAWVICHPVTDEPFAWGVRVWVSQAVDGTWIVHGGVR